MILIQAHTHKVSNGFNVNIPQNVKCGGGETGGYLQKMEIACVDHMTREQVKCSFTSVISGKRD